MDYSVDSTLSLWTTLCSVVRSVDSNGVRLVDQANLPETKISRNLALIESILIDYQWSSFENIAPDVSPKLLCLLRGSFDIALRHGLMCTIEAFCNSNRLGKLVKLVTKCLRLVWTQEPNFHQFRSKTSEIRQLIAYIYENASVFNYGANIPDFATISLLGNLITFWLNMKIDYLAMLINIALNGCNPTVRLFSFFKSTVLYLGKAELLVETFLLLATNFKQAYTNNQLQNVAEILPLYKRIMDRIVLEYRLASLEESVKQLMEIYNYMYVHSLNTHLEHKHSPPQIAANCEIDFVPDSATKDTTSIAPDPETSVGVKSIPYERKPNKVEKLFNSMKRITKVLTCHY